MEKRLFIALNLPLQARKILESHIHTLQEQNRHIRVKWVETENLHLTLHFLGYVEEERVEEVENILQQGCKNVLPLQAELGELGGFPNAHRPQIIWVKLKEKSGGLLKLYLQLKQELMNRGYEVDMRPFKPHITLGRVKVPQVFKGLDIPVIDSQFIIRSIELIKSELLTDGPKYTILCQTFLE